LYRLSAPPLLFGARCYSLFTLYPSRYISYISYVYMHVYGYLLARARSFYSFFYKNLSYFCTMSARRSLRARISSSTHYAYLTARFATILRLWLHYRFYFSIAIESPIFKLGVFKRSTSFALVLYRITHRDRTLRNPPLAENASENTACLPIGEAR